MDSLIEAQINRLSQDGWRDRALIVLIKGGKKEYLASRFQDVHLIGSKTFIRMFRVMGDPREKLMFLMKLVTNSRGLMDFSPYATYQFDPDLGPDNKFFTYIADLVTASYPETKKDHGSNYIGLNDSLGAKIQLFRQLIDQQNINFLLRYAKKIQKPPYQALLIYLKNKNQPPQFRVEANFHSKYLRSENFRRQKTFKVEVLDKRCEYIFSLNLGHPLVSQWVDGARLLPDGSFDLGFDYSDSQQENILDGESFNFGNTKYQHRYLDVNQPVVPDLRTKFKNQHRWISEDDWYSKTSGNFADLIRENSELDLNAWDEYQISVGENEDLLVQKYRDFVQYCRNQNANLGFAQYYKTKA